MADRLDFVAAHHSAGRIRGRVDAQQPRVADHWTDLICGRKKIRFRSDLDLDRDAAREVGVVIVVPRRRRIDDLIARIDDRRVRREDQRP